MFILANELGVQAAQFDARVMGRELPVDLGSTKVAIAFPGGNLVRQALPVVDPARQALPSEHTQFAFGDVQPASVFRRVVNLQAFVFRVVPQRLTGTQRQRLANFTHECICPF